MKIRNGLVSNSSTSSFVLFGYHIERSAEEVIKSLVENENIDEDYIWDHLYNGVKVEGCDQEFSGFHGDDLDKKGIVLGIQPMYLGEDESSDIPLEFEEIKEALDLLAEKLGLDKSKKRLFAGTRAC